MMTEEAVFGTRVFGEKFTPDLFEASLAPFITHANLFGSALVVSQETYPFKKELEEFAVTQRANGKDITIRYSSTEGNKSPAGMCNEIVQYAHDKGKKLFAIISGDLAGFIPQAFPLMLKQFEEDAKLATVGMAVQGVHNFAVLKKVEQNGMEAIKPDNFATVYHNNAFSIHRTEPRGLNTEQRLFPRVTDQGTLGSVDIDGAPVLVGGNEEIALMMQLLSQGYFLKVKLLAGQDSLVRDARAELTSIDKKAQRRIPVAKRYQEYYEVSDDDLTNYLHGGSYLIHI